MEILSKVAATQFDHHNEEKHDEEVRAGVPVVLFDLLISAIRKLSVKNVLITQQLEIAMLCNVLEMTFRCSPRLRMFAMKKIGPDFVTQMWHIVNVISQENDHPTIRDLAIKKIAKILHRTGNQSMKDCSQDLLNTLKTILLIQETSLADAQLDASKTIANLASGKEHKQTIQHFPGLVDALISAALQCDKFDRRECMSSKKLELEASRALVNISASTNPSDRNVLFSKKDDIFSLLANLMNRSDSNKRLVGIMISKNMASCISMSQVLLQTAHADGFISGLNYCASANNPENVRECCATAIKTMISPITAVYLAKDDFFLDTLVVLGSSSSKDSLRLNVAIALSKLSKTKEMGYDNAVACMLVGFLGSENRTIQLMTMQTIKSLSELPDIRRFLANHEGMVPILLAQMIAVRSHGTNDVLATKVIKNLAMDQGMQEALCRDEKFMTMLVGIVSGNIEVCREKKVPCIHIVALLAEYEPNCKYLSRYTEIVPALSNFANSTTADDAFKKLLIFAILRINKPILDKAQSKISAAGTMG
eukprot:scaffold107349_cov55-Attheya_sp.AAC.2